MSPESIKITAMARAYYEALPANYRRWQGLRVKHWLELDALERDAAHDAMWQALKLLREPTPEMVDAGLDQDNEYDRFPAMIDKLLEVK